MESFFDRVAPVWPQGRRDLHWHLLPTLREATALTQPYTALTAQCGLYQVVPGRIHCTVLHAIGADVASRDVRDSIKRLVDDVTARVADVEPFTVTFGRAEVGNVAIEACGWPGRPHRILTERVLSAHQAIWSDTYRLSPSRYPHASLAYTGEGAAAVDRAGLKAQLADIEGHHTVSMAVARLHLVAQWHDGAHLMWDPIAEVPLAGVTA
ncbi:2'-5' RNA ligase family protein [Streptomyces sp. WAC05858]|uniref:2'-5' RNA ligase family protein n=1 Tax=Streptomyces TaxID=1883 RepID=UPI000F795839|nr:hypothetical protein [Streptomyces sp. WAC05858]RSS34196.1 hypothetical protein EF902_41445 [Streptomyces sp. WAC05858]